MDYELQQVPQTHIDLAWKDGAHLLSEACDESGGEITGDQLKLMLSRGERILFAALKDKKPVGWCVIRIDQLPNVRAMHICEVYAKGNLFKEFVDQMAVIARNQGCSEMRCSAKPAHARLYAMKFGFEPVYTTLKVAL
jgi:hypothetical protein